MPTNKELCTRAETALKKAKYDPKKLILIHAGTVSIVILLMAVVDLLLGSAIDTTGGLSGMGLRAILSTAKSLLQITQRTVLPFWNLGFLYAAMGMARGSCEGPRDLLMGFRRCVPQLFALLYIFLRLILLATAVSYLAVTLLSFTPLSDSAMEIIGGMNISSAYELDDATMAQVTQALMPLIVISVIVGIATIYAASYRYRLLNYCVFDSTNVRDAIMENRRLSSGSKLRLFKLDLHFWWYYLLSALLSAILYGDVLLSILGVNLPLSTNLSFLLFYSLYLLGNLALCYFCKNRVQVAYACFYDELKNPGKSPMSITE